MRRHRGGANFTHFASLPFISSESRTQLNNLQNQINEYLKKIKLDQYVTYNNPNLFHLTLSMLTLPHNNQKARVKEILDANKQQIESLLKGLKLTTTSIGYFTRRNNERSGNRPKQNHINVIYLDIAENQQYRRVERAIDFFLRLFLKEQIIAENELKGMNIQYDHNANLFKNKKLHITLFRCRGLSETEEFLALYQQIKGLYEGKRIGIQSFDISTRFEYDETKFYTPLYRLPLHKIDQK